MAHRSCRADCNNFDESAVLWTGAAKTVAADFVVIQSAYTLKMSCILKLPPVRPSIIFCETMKRLLNVAQRIRNTIIKRWRSKPDGLVFPPTCLTTKNGMKVEGYWRLRKDNEEAYVQLAEYQKIYADIQRLDLWKNREKELLQSPDFYPWPEAHLEPHPALNDFKTKLTQVEKEAQFIGFVHLSSLSERE